jgi:transcriptional regulator with XRE-family HTH domain
MAIQDLGVRLRHARNHRKMSQGTLAKAAGIKQPSISELESGETKVISGDTLIAIAQALHVRPEWIVNGRGQMEADPLAALEPDERELLEKYRAAAPRWKISIRYMAALRGDVQQDEAAESMNVVLAKVAANPVPDHRLGTNWTRPDSPSLHQDTPPPYRPKKK